MQNPHRNKQWLQEQASKGLWYGPIAKLANVKPPTITKYMAQYGIYTVVPQNILDNVRKLTETDVVAWDILYSFVIPGNPTVKKNSNPTGKHGMRLPNKQYMPYEMVNLPYLIQYAKDNNITTIDSPVTLKFLFYRQDKIRCDISNLYEAPQDIMTKAGILKDDNCNIVVSHHSDSRVKYDKLFPRTEVYIYKAER